MKKFNTLAIILISLFNLSVCKDQVEVFKDLTLTAQAQSGAIVISVNYTINSTVATDTVTVTINSLVEKDVNGVAIEDPNHSFTDFSGLNFTIDEFKVNLYENDPSLIVVSTANVISNTNSTITVHAILYTEDGMVETGAKELVEVKEGYIKLIYEIKNWQFCTHSAVNCTGINCCLQGNGTQIGAYLDLSFAVQGSQIASTNDNLLYNLGNSDLILSQYASIDDGAWTQLETKYPLFQSQGNSNIFTVRFPTFNSSAIYDPIITMNRIDRHNSLKNIGLIIGIFLIIIALLMAFYYYRYFKRSRLQENLIA